jgi:hypothetical protein
MVSRIALSAAVIVAVAASEARAQTCSDEIALLAKQYSLKADLPQAPSSGSMGVIAPPEVGAARVLDPPRQDDPMVTTPEVRPQTQSGETPNADLDAAKHARMQGLLDAARDAQKRGDEQACLDRVAKARAIPEPG